MSRIEPPQPSSPSAVPSSRRLRKRRSSWQRRLRYFYHRVIRMRESPEVLARGLAAGVFSGWFPWFGLQIVIAVALAALFRGNKLIAAAATWISNTFTSIPIFALNFQVGQWLLNSGHESYDFTDLTSWHKIGELGSDFLVTLFLGSLVMGTIFGIASYFLGLWLVRRARDRRLARRKRMLRSIKL